MKNKHTIFLDLEVNKKNKKINEFGLIYKDDELKTSSLQEVKEFINNCDTLYICGHNLIDFDLEILKETSLYQDIQDFSFIDTLPLSLLLFNQKTIHSLPKNYKSEDDFANDPVEDSKITLELLCKLEEEFLSLPENSQNIFYSLLKDDKYFSGFFKYINISNPLTFSDTKSLKNMIYDIHKNVIVNKEYLEKIIDSNSVELSYILALLTPHIEIKSHPPKVLYSYPSIVQIQKKLCFDIDKTIDELSAFSKETFGFGTFRIFQRLNADIFDDQTISQKEIIEASLKDDSFLAILPTGGGKTFTFWLPAIIKAKAYKSLTVIISPLQALIEDHITSFESKVANYKAVAISGFMSPLERAEAIEQTINGEADILYIAPESLRSNVIFSILKNRFIERFVIDEAHCLSTWGNDFRQDYFYICEYVQDLLKNKPFQDHIPISCFTATAKPSVIEDINQYILKGLDIKLNKYLAVPERKNLQYKSIPSSKKDKYRELLKLINNHEGSTLVYIPSSTKDCDDVAEQLSMDTTKVVKSFHSKLDSQKKMEILKGYIENTIDIIVATTAFGMGVDKSNITNVIHYEISESLENYAQEAGRGARDENLTASCPILFDEDDMDKHFNSLNRSKLTANEINSIFKVIKNYPQDIVNKTAFELARDAGWDVEDNENEYNTKIKTALLELEREGYLSRKRNKTQFFADSIASKSLDKLNKHFETSVYSKEEKVRLSLILNTIVGNGKVESVQIDELADQLGYKKDEISLSIHQLKQMDILGDSKDLNLETKKSDIKKFPYIKQIEIKLFNYLNGLNSDKVTTRELNEYLYQEKVITKNQVELIKSIIKNWKNKSTFLFTRINRERDLWYFEFKDKKSVKDKINLRHNISDKLLNIFFKQIDSKDKKEIQFSLKELYLYLDKEVDIQQIDKTLLYLHHLKIIELLKGRFINYSPMNLIKEEKIKIQNKIYTKNEYKNRLEKHYQTKIESIHIMCEYASRLKDDNHKAILFLKDYFTLPYDNFKKQYNLLKKRISRPISQKRYNKIFTQMSDEQKLIINDKTTKAMMILAGPGSGKTRVLVHKIASLILTEDIKPEQFMMLTFSKSAKWEFKTRLNELVGALSYDVEIQTFHSYALKLIARDTKQNDEILNQAIKEATKSILDGDIRLPYKAVLVLDEYQDINQDSFELVKAIYNTSDKEMRIIAVGDDDQCIMNHIGADTKFIDLFKTEFACSENDEDLYKKYELSCNFRSKKHIVEYSNQFIKNITNRYKDNVLYPNSSANGEVSVYINSCTNLITPTTNLVKELVNKDEKNKNIAILAFTNDEVMQIYSQLQENGIDAKYIIDREKFHLKNIIEIVEFEKVLNSYLNDETRYLEQYFYNALEVIKERFSKSSNIKLLVKIVNRFLQESEEYYISQWLSYLEEIKLEDFENYSKNIIISTIHKSKGMEFDKVILVNNLKKNHDTKSNKDELVRLYYVGMTRAKNELYIIKNGRQRPLPQEYVTYIIDTAIYDKSNQTYTYIMSLSDISLSFNSNRHNYFTGENVFLTRQEKFQNLCITQNEKILGTLSKEFNNTIMNKLKSGYRIDKVIIENIVVWHDKDNKQYLKHPLCKITLQLKNL
ncbi:RecQ family ATP-dependent DNA helicase [Arcobacter sp. 15-2]|uniref:RecQ family ATP-dependent DNA helicase n=1 Tax=Arcobacter sp. 15-2 TaxID=3374109 RepID=UPI00399C9310